MNLGTALLQIEALGAPSDLDECKHAHSFQVQEFRRPEFEVTARAGPGTASGRRPGPGVGQGRVLRRRRPARGRGDLDRYIISRAFHPARPV